MIDDAHAIDIDPYTIISGHRKAMCARLGVDVFDPAGRPVVCRHVGRRLVSAPGEIDGLIIANQARSAQQITVRVVGSLPSIEGGNNGPLQRHGGIEGVFDILEHDGVFTRRQPGVPHKVSGALCAPLVEHQQPIDIEPRTIVGTDVKAIGPLGQVVFARPAHREIVTGQTAVRLAKAPVKIDAGIVTHQPGRALEFVIGKVLAAPLGDVNRRRRTRNRRLGRVQLFPRHTGPCDALEFKELDDDLMLARAHVALDDVFSVAPVPAVQDEHTIDVEPHAVISAHLPVIVARAKVDATRPSH